ncbi:hypothetical protein [Brucella tritici]|uniref:Uncharacterized protein n=1 Tax=Brucella tritici TaxID=94626 RepID=A0A6L3YWE7_9HYPH|nr:hypothetical protein [Brucella tritici]KAB2689670.1 hypothetical protein F9L08_03155 [Brucella tritici]
MTKITHNDLSVRDEVSITGCNGKWTIAEIDDGYRGINVVPEDGRTPEGVWVDVSEVVAITKRYDEAAERDRASEIEYHEAFAKALRAGNTMAEAQKEAERAQGRVYSSWEI